MRENIQKNKKYILLTGMCLLFVVMVWLFKYKEPYNYMNSNASWHVLLTIQAYDETPAVIHKFLPIVSLGDELDKEIQWAEMVADEYGNYYYTSFSPAGFALPYFFLKLFHLPVAEGSLYIFNTVLCCMALLFTIKLFIDLFEKYLRKEVVILLTTFLFAFQTELMHGMGQVFWHQSLLQVLLPLQFLCFYHFNEEKKWKIGYFVLTVIMPYVEWTGFLANVGFALAFFFKHGLKIQKQDFMRAFWTGVCTVAALLLLCGHYLSVVEWTEFTGALRDRVAMRTTYAHAPLFNLIWGYWKSFKGLWILLVILMTGCVLFNKGVKWIWNYRHLLPMFFVMAFPMLENLLMKEHATSYTYDRMKLIYPLLLLAFIAGSAEPKKWFASAAVVLSAVFGIIGVGSYLKNTEYIWPAEYRMQNQILAEYCKENYHEGCLYGLGNAAVRGYVNLLFDRGVYENISLEKLIEKAKERDAEYAVLLEAGSEPDPANVWNMYAFSKVTVHELATGIQTEIRVIDGEIVEEGIRE